MIRNTALLTIVLLAVPAITFAWQEPTSRVDFESQVRSILKTHCWQCHGEEEELQGGLDARLARFLTRGGDSGPAVVAGDHAGSLLYQRVASGEMPPGKKKLSADEVQRIAQWIDAGAKASLSEPESLPPGDIFSEHERGHWSFQPIRRPPVPAVHAASRVATPVDAFLLARLESQGQTFGPEADRATLIRRITYDLTGLPPTPQAVHAFVNDTAGDAYERLVDRLLASPAYGERWARHWLDVAGYADSDGYNERDAERKWAYRYRDYVIRSLNADKPWSEFIVEQLAGDELLSPPYANLTPAQSDCLIATGFLRMGPDGTADGAADPGVARNDVVADTVKIVSTSLLGLTVGCAQCHAHRYDPISHVDYHRLRALFEPAYDWKNWRAPPARLVSLWPDEVRAQAAAVEAELQKVGKRRNEELDKLVQETLERELATLPVEVQPAARAARAAQADQRTAEQQELIKQYPFLNVDRGSVYLYLPDRLTGFNKKWDELTEATRNKKPADDLVLCLTEVPGQIPPTKLFARGDFNQPRQDVLPGEIAVLNSSQWSVAPDDPSLPTSGRRLAYARHLTDGGHPLVARVLVNRFWLHHFGRGLVATPGDFGQLGERPSHPELLDWLADEFMRGGWRLKRLQRMIVLSSAYRQSSQRRESLDAVDPENRLLGRMNVRRLEAEAIRDALLSVAGQLSPKMFGTPVPVAPDEVGQIVVAVDTRDSAGRPTGKVVPLGEEEFRRSIYVQVRRSQPLGMLDPFDAPLMTPNCDQRASSTVAPQSLLMMNSAFVVRQAEVMATRIVREAGEDTAAQFRLAWQLAFSREPTDGEVQAGVAFLTSQTQSLAAVVSAEAKAGTPQPPQLALAHLCQAFLSSNGFLYVD